MALGALIGAGAATESSQPVVPTSAKGSWIIANDDAETAQSAAEQLNPCSINDSTFHWVKIGVGTRIVFRARYAVGATVTTSPVVGIWGAWPIGFTATNDFEAGTVATDGTVKTMRLDTTDSGGAGITLTLVSSGTGMAQDGTYAYSDPYSLTGTDLQGAPYIGVVVMTAANVNSGTVPIEVLILN